jgi:hypothetical protein
LLARQDTLVVTYLKGENKRTSILSNNIINQ